MATAAVAFPRRIISFPGDNQRVAAALIARNRVGRAGSRGRKSREEKASMEGTAIKALRDRKEGRKKVAERVGQATKSLQLWGAIKARKHSREGKAIKQGRASQTVRRSREGKDCKAEIARKAESASSGRGAIRPTRRQKQRRANEAEDPSRPARVSWEQRSSRIPPNRLVWREAR